MLLDDLCPQPAAGAKLRHLLEQVAEDVEVERQPPGEFVDRQAAPDHLVGVGLRDAERVGHLLRRVRARFADVIAADRHRAVLRRMLRAVLDRVTDEPHRRLDRVDPGAAPDELLEDVVLRRPAQLRHIVAALLGHREIHGDELRRRAVHRERHGDRIEVDAVEGDLEIAQRVDRHADAADLAVRERVVRVEPALRRQVERDVEPGLAVRDEVLEALVGVGRIAEAGVLAHRVRPVPVHRRVDAAHEGVAPRLADEAVAAARLHVGRGVERLDLDSGFVHHGPQRRIQSVVHGLAPCTLVRMKLTMSSSFELDGKMPRKPSSRSRSWSWRGRLPPITHSLSPRPFASSSVFSFSQ